MLTSTDSYKPEYFSQFARIEISNFWFCARKRLILWGIRRYSSKRGRFLEIGCGTGFVMSAIEKAFPHFLLYGSDVFIEGIKFAKERLSRTKLFLMDARRIPSEGKFDIIGVFDILEHIKEDDLVFTQMYQALNDKGVIILTVPQHNFLWSKFDDASCHLRRYNAVELRTKIEKSGFDIIKITSFVSLLFPLMWMSRLWEKLSKPKKYNIAQIAEFGSVINFLLEKILDFERGLISLGLHFPFGGSLFLVARKKVAVKVGEYV